MLAHVAERKMRAVRGILLTGWIALIASLLWDPLTPVLTSAESWWSPWRIADPTYRLRGHDLSIGSYPIGARLFWTVLIPIVPLFLMLFGHEAWRRICPLSFASQLPRMLGFQRGVWRARDASARAAPLINPTGWMARHAWSVQFALLFCGLTARLLGANGDRSFLAALLVVVILGAVASGVMWGGKTWCNYFCPVNVVQRIYTEPRGLLESAPHVHRPSIPQSMCRSPGSPAELDRSACVGCTRHCGDVDLERAYWSTINEVQRQNVYYMFTGLIIGFYGYYRVFAGDWGYYFSGVWTHEPGQLGRILDPGVAALPGAWWLPKLVAAPLVMGASCALSLLIGRTMQDAYVQIRTRPGGPPRAVLLHHCLALSSFASITIFYVFGGRPNLRLLPPSVLHWADVAIFAITSLWLWKVLPRTPNVYQRESVASDMVAVLAASSIDFNDRFDGRDLGDLRPEELYLVGRMLPSTNPPVASVVEPTFLAVPFSVPRGAADGSGASAAHSETELILDPDERQRSIEDYEGIFGACIADKLEEGLDIAAALDLPELAATGEILRASFQITPSDHDAMLIRLRAPDGLFVERAVSLLADREALLEVERSAAAAPPAYRPLLDRLLDVTQSRRASLARGAGLLLAETGRWSEGELTAITMGSVSNEVRPAFDLRDHHLLLPVQRKRIEPEAAIRLGRGIGLLQREPQAVALWLCSRGDRGLATRAVESLQRASIKLADLTAEVLDILDVDRLGTSGKHGIGVELQGAGAPGRFLLMGHQDVSLGSAKEADLSIIHSALASFHLLIRREGRMLKVTRLTDAPLLINEVPCDADGAIVPDGAQLTIGRSTPDGLGIRLFCEDSADDWNVFDRMSCIAAAAEHLHEALLDLPALEIAARSARVTRLLDGDAIVLPPADHQQTVILYEEAPDHATIHLSEEASGGPGCGRLRVVQAGGGRDLAWPTAPKQHLGPTLRKPATLLSLQPVACEPTADGSVVRPEELVS